ncbi:putative major pilin subunit [Oxobacter pfennigii]|uniref:Putative major pilin subunit n=1 Tax=Oxobacter pfennigii TaxID=36849 RepID=A0A0P8YCP3_9CLOT|nr:GspH/FimT family pseudopilin [Oxobacter pfennigii]KPU44934.1 putative major pilin subunit [Oxobacter pfennigii]
MNKKKGMTLIELISAIAIISIITGISMPLFNNFSYKNQHTMLDIAAKELLSDLRLAQSKARSEGYTYHVYFNRTNNSYMIYSYKNSYDNVYKNKKLPAGIGFDNIYSTYKDNKVSFNSNGHAVPYPCTVSLTNNFKEFRKITITVGSYYISIRD